MDYQKYSVIDDAISKMKLSAETIGIYTILTAESGDISAIELLKMLDSVEPQSEAVVKMCVTAIWELY